MEEELNQIEKNEKWELLDHVVIDANGLIIWENVGLYVIDVNGLV
jgi:hypothetical protein